MSPFRPAIVIILAGGLSFPGTAVLAKSPKGKTVYGAIAFNRDTRAVGYAYDFKKAPEAKREALAQCGEKKCEVVASFKNGCGAVASSRSKLTAMTGITRDEAETKAMRKCGKECAVVAWACTK